MRYLAISLVLALEVASTPVHKAQSPFGSLPPLSQDVNSNAAMEALLDKYAPVIKLSCVSWTDPADVQKRRGFLSQLDRVHVTSLHLRRSIHVWLRVRRDTDGQIETMDGAVHPIVSRPH